MLIFLYTPTPTHTHINPRAVGPRAGETTCEIAVAASGRIDVAKLGAIIHPYPTHGFGLQSLASKVAEERWKVSFIGKIYHKPPTPVVSESELGS